MTAVQNMPYTATPQAATSPRPRLLTALTIVTPILVLVGVGLALFYAGTDIDQGQVQRIFYIHVSAFTAAFMAFGAALVGGVAYLRTRSIKWDTLALAGVEVGLTCALINLVTGMIWARPIWNTWWTWDPRLTSEAIMILTYAAYLFLRNGIENPERKRRFASVYGILAMFTVIITFIIIRIRPDTIHPTVIGSSPQNAQGGFAMADAMRNTLGINSAIWTIFVPATLIWWRIRIQNVSERANALKANLHGGQP